MVESLRLDATFPLVDCSNFKRKKRERPITERNSSHVTQPVFFFFIAFYPLYPTFWQAVTARIKIDDDLLDPHVLDTLRFFIAHTCAQLQQGRADLLAALRRDLKIALG